MHPCAALSRHLMAMDEEHELMGVRADVHDALRGVRLAHVHLLGSAERTTRLCRQVR